eukprot:scaffold20195_cov95-Phaeocystis_antarctica.AAC.1
MQSLVASSRPAREHALLSLWRASFGKQSVSSVLGGSGSGSTTHPSAACGRRGLLLRSATSRSSRPSVLPRCCSTRAARLRVHRTSDHGLATCTSPAPRRQWGARPAAASRLPRRGVVHWDRLPGGRGQPCRQGLRRQ